MNGRLDEICAEIRHISEDPVNSIEINDSKWLDIFLTNFIEHEHHYKCEPDQQVHEHEGIDDLLFFVRLKPENPPLDSMFVKRKVGNKLPELEEMVNWKETFFLNLISQTIFEMTVSVCEKKVITPSECEDESKEGGEGNKRRLEPIKFVKKRVYASPHRTRMDKKTSETEPSYPTIYFCVNDYEDAFGDIIVQIGQYLTVELFIKNHSDEKKVCLFQGAVPFNALFDTYQAKQSQAAQNPLKLFQKFTRSLQATFSNDEMSNTANDEVNTEYIMMRGPNGKGHAQVAIKSIQENLACYMTYIHLPWSSIVNDLLSKE